MAFLRARSWLALIGAFCVVACSGESSPVATESSIRSCDPPRRLVAGRCLEPGVQDDGCAAGTLLREDGACAQAGVLPELCPEGFEARDGGCEPALPSAPCPAGQIAIPGDTSCHEPMPCGTTPWGDAPFDASTQYVDASYTGTGDGTVRRPWKTIGAALAAVARGGMIAIATGTYDEQITVSKPVRIWGRCSAYVEIVGATNAATVTFTRAADASELHGVTLRGGPTGALVDGAQDVTLDGIRVRGTSQIAVQLSSQVRTARAKITRSLIDGCTKLGVLVDGSDLSIDSSVIRGTTLDPQDGLSAGLSVQNREDDNDAGSVTMRRVLLEENHGGGVLSSGAHLDVEGVVVRDTMTRARNRHGRGIQVQSGFGDAMGDAHIKGSVIEGSHSAGIYVLGARATIEGVTVRDTKQAADYGMGIAVWDRHPQGTPASDLTLRWSLLERNLSLGLLVSGSRATIEGVLVRDTLDGSSAAPAGIWIQRDPQTGTAASATVRGVDVRSSPQIGVGAYDAEMTIEGAKISGTRMNPLDRSWGDAISIYAGSGLPVTISGSLLHESERSGLSVWGGPLRMSGSRVDCNVIALDAELLPDRETLLDDAGGNACGCGDLGPCKAVSSTLAPPKPLTTVD